MEHQMPLTYNVNIFRLLTQEMINFSSTVYDKILRTEKRSWKTN